MYACESIWFKREQRKKGLFKTMRYYAGKVLLIIFVAILLSILLEGFYGKTKTPETHTLLAEEKVAQTMEDLPEGEESIPSEEKNSGFENNDSWEEYNITETEAKESGAPLIVIDPGHGGMDEGCSREGMEEKDYNLEMALMLKEKLEELGFRVILTRSEDEEVGLAERVQIATDVKADMFIGIHQNASECTAAEGVETWYYDNLSGDNKRLAALVQNYVILHTKANNRGIQESEDLYVIRECGIPSCLIETGFMSNEKEFELLQSEEYREKIVQGIADAVWYYYNPKKMYLTFDDGPSKENTVRILDFLKERNIKATFFVVGENVEKYPEIIKRMVQEGHTIGIHCYSHSYEEIYNSAEGFVADFEKAKEAVLEVVDVDVWCYRFPGGSINSHNKDIYKDIIAKMSDMGYVYFDWNASMEDSLKNTTKEQIIRNAVESTLQRKKVVMLGHDIVYNTSVSMEELLECLPEYEFLPLTKDVTPIQFKQ